MKSTDANAALAMSMGTEYGDALEMLRLEDERVAAPTLLAAEVAHALTKYVRGKYLTPEEAADCGRDAIALVDDFHDDGSLWAEPSRLSPYKTSKVFLSVCIIDDSAESGRSSSPKIACI